MDVNKELHRAERFVSAFNAIDKHMRGAVKTTRGDSFPYVLTQFTRKNGWFKNDSDSLRAFNDLRNVVVHQRYEPNKYLSIPTEEVVEQLEAIRERLLKPKRVLPRFKATIITVQATDSIAYVLGHISRHDFSQFPVYEGERFQGLLTENGLTRWLAHHVQHEDSLVELTEEQVAMALRDEEERANHAFFSRNALLAEAINAFQENLFLEAVLITHNGRPIEKLLGLITRWDVLTASRS